MSVYDEYDYLEVTVEDGIALVEIGNPGYTMRGHYEINSIWRDLDRDPEVRAAILTWAVPAKDPLGDPCAENRPPSATRAKAAAPIAPPTPSRTTAGCAPPAASSTAAGQSGRPTCRATGWAERWWRSASP